MFHAPHRFISAISEITLRLPDGVRRGCGGVAAVWLLLRDCCLAAAAWRLYGNDCGCCFGMAAAWLLLRGNDWCGTKPPQPSSVPPRLPDFLTAAFPPPSVVPAPTPFGTGRRLFFARPCGGETPREREALGRIPTPAKYPLRNLPRPAELLPSAKGSPLRNLPP